jgi:hypothetical protein
MGLFDKFREKQRQAKRSMILLEQLKEESINRDGLFVPRVSPQEISQRLLALEEKDKKLLEERKLPEEEHGS